MTFLTLTTAVFVFMALTGPHSPMSTLAIVGAWMGAMHLGC
jgi:hypothetical protein